MPSEKVSLSLAQAKQAALRAQGLWKPLPDLATAKRQMPDLVATLGAVQLDTISVLARSHQLVAHARLGALTKNEVEAAYWQPAPDSTHFEYWAHAASLLPIEMWPYQEFRRIAYRNNGKRWHEVPTKILKEVESHIRKEGAVTSGDLGPSRNTNYWWSWSEHKVALEWLLDIGVLVCVNRVGWRRQYDLAERAIEQKLLTPIDSQTALHKLLSLSIDRLGVATKNDLLDFYRLSRNEWRPALNAAWEDFLSSPEIIEIEVKGWDQPAYATATAIEELDQSKPRRSVLLSPFDSLIWYRPRTERLFGMQHRLEAYTPAAKRQYGYFAMPVLAGDKLIARVDPNKKGKTLRAVKVSFESAKPSAKEIQSVAEALVEAARWIQADQVVVEDCKVAKIKLNQALATMGVR